MAVGLRLPRVLKAIVIWHSRSASEEVCTVPPGKEQRMVTKLACVIYIEKTTGTMNR